MSEPSITPKRIAELVEPTLTSAGYDVEEVKCAPATDGGTAVTVIVDRDGGATLDALSTLTRTTIDVLDPVLGETAYTLEITTPGITRPLTTPTHWRRAQGRKVTVKYSDDAGAKKNVSGRIGVSDDSGVTIVENRKGRFATTRVDFNSVTKAVVGVDFSAPNATELEMCGVSPQQQTQNSETQMNDTNE